MDTNKKKFSNPFKGREGAFNPRKANAMNEPMDEAGFMAMLKDIQRMEREFGPEEFERLLSESLDELSDEAKMSGSDLDFDGIPDDEWDMDFDEPITKEEWQHTHPANITCGSDKYYADLATLLTDIVASFNLPPSTPEGFCREVGKVLAAYLEDVVSGTKVFSAMRRVCYDRYGYYLPFYDCLHDNYMPDHINEEDIRFLIWMTICRLGKKQNSTYSPLAPGWELIANRLFDHLNEQFPKAPEATRIAGWLKTSFRSGDYLNIREIAIWLVMHNPMTCFSGLYEELLTQTTNFDYSINPNIDPSTILYSITVSEAWQRSMSPMGCPSRTLVAAIATEFGNSGLAAEIEAIEVLPLQIFKVSREAKSRHIIFEDAANREYVVERNSFAKGFRPDEIGYAKCNLVCYKGQYLLNGLLSGDVDLKEEWEEATAPITPEQQRNEASGWIESLEGRQVVCITKIKPFLAQLGFPPNTGSEYPGAKNFVALISRELGLTFLPDAGYAFDLPGNRAYRKRRAAKESFMHFIFHNAIPYDVARYIQEHNLLPEAKIGASQGEEVGRRIIQDYIAFWIGFYSNLPAYGRTMAYSEPD